ncbi:MAG: FAD-dependent oxidoreductase [Candidatus Bathyarchaeota archaeon]|nr:MAG: FAD-dependent oxidoreductase [Candidatus Bathyarchaeota archaeon]
MKKRIVVVGCGAAGWSAAFAARKTDRKAQIIIIEQGKYPVYERGGIPYVIQGEISTFESLINFSPEYYNLMKMNVHLETEATTVDSSAKEITIAGRAKTEHRINYDSLILATGASPFIIPVPGSRLTEVYGVRTLDDGRKIMEKCNSAKSAVVVGARLVGLEMAVALRQRGLDVTVIELLPQILDGILDPKLSSEVQRKLKKADIDFILGAGISEILGENHVEAVRAGTHQVKADMVVMATGVRGRTELAQQMGVELGETKLIKVDEHMETSVKGVYAAGDCVECVNAVTGMPTVSQLGTNAIRQGKAAGTNAAGGFMTYPQVLGSCATRLLDTEIASTGLTESNAKKLGINPVSASTLAPARPICYPERFHVRIKLVADKVDGKLIGAQIISGKEAGPRIDTISLAIMKGTTANDLILFDHAYSPPVADSADPLAIVAEILSRKLV